MSNFDFLLKDFKFDTTSITYSYSYVDSLWDGKSPDGKTIFFNNTTKKSLSGSEQTYFTLAIDAWDKYSAFSISDTLGRGDTNIYKVTFNVSEFNGDVGTPWFKSDTDTTIVDGQTYSGLYARSEIAISNNFSITAAGGQGYWIALHEFGHALGLDEAGGGYDPNYNTAMTVMSFNVPDFHYSITPMAYDIAALKEQYGSFTRNPENENSYDQSTLGITGAATAQTIVDTGGTGDKLDLSGIAGSHIIDLRQAIDGNDQWTNAKTVINGVVNDSKEWIFIAKDTVIENAIGGTGNDRIIGNNSSNILDGGAGNDILSGGEGNDHVFGQSEEDTFVGGDGIDIYDGGVDADTVTYAALNAAFGLSNNPNGDFLARKYYNQTSPTGTYETDTLIAIENFTLGAAKDLIDVDSINGLKFDGGGETDTLDYGRSGYGITATLKDPSVESDYNLEVSGLTSTSTWTHLGRNLEIVKGTGHQDTFIIQKMIDGMTVDGVLGIDTLDASSQTGALTFDLIEGELRLNPTIDFLNFETFKGGSGMDTFKVNDAQKEYKFYGNGESDTADYSGVNAFIKVLSIPNLWNNSYTVEKYYGQTSATGAFQTDYLYSIEDIIGDTGNGISIDGAGGTVKKGDNQMNTLSPNGTTGPLSLYGYGNIDLLHGGAGNDYLDGGAGNDTVGGGGGDDTYVYRRGEGDDTFDDYNNSTSLGHASNIDTLRFTGGIAFSDLTFAKNGSTHNVVISIAGGGQVTIYFQTSTTPIDILKFDDGTTVDMETVLVPVYGTNGTDGLAGTTEFTAKVR